MSNVYRQKCPSHQILHLFFCNFIFIFAHQTSILYLVSEEAKRRVVKIHSEQQQLCRRDPVPSHTWCHPLPASLGKVLLTSDLLGQLCTYSTRFYGYCGICDCNETAAHDDNDGGGGYDRVNEDEDDDDDDDNDDDDDGDDDDDDDDDDDNILYDFL